MPKVNIRKAKARLSRLVKKAAKTRKPGRLKGKVRVGDDFDAPLPDDLLKQFNEGPIFP